VTLTIPLGIGTEAPELPSTVRLGPRLRSGPRYAHGLYDNETSALYQVGEREVFVIARLAGHGTAQRIAADYLRRFRKELTPQGWAQIIQLLQDRALLASDTNAETNAHRRAEVCATNLRVREGSRTLFSAHWDIGHPHQVMATLAPRLGWLFSMLALVIIGGGGAMMVTWLAVFAPILASEVTRLWTATPVAGVVGIVIIWVSVAVHELSHGIAHVRCGGQVTAVGLKWRFPLLAAYCTTADVKVLTTHRRQVIVALAGVVGSFVVLLPNAVLFLFPEGSFGRGIGVIAISLGTVTTLVNLVPVFAMDGYKALNAALGFWELRRDTFLYARTFVTRGIGKELRSRFPRTTTLWCRIYLIFLIILAVATIAVAVALLSSQVGVAGALGIIGCPVAVLIISGAIGARIVRRRAEELTRPEHGLAPIRWSGASASRPLDPSTVHSKEREDD